MNSVTVVIDSLERGGAQRVVVGLLPSWVAAGRTIRLITFQDGETDSYSIPPEVERVVIGGVGDSPNLLRAVLANIKRIARLRAALKASYPGSVLSLLTPINVLVILASLGLGLRIVVSERNDPVRQNPGYAWGMMRRICYRLADIVTANTDHAIDMMADYTPRTKLKMVPNAVNLPAKRARPDCSHVVLNVGRMVAQKNQQMIVSAYSQIAKKDPDWNLNILGDGPERGHIARLVQSEGIDSRVALSGFVMDPSKQYADSAIFVLASEYEGTPNTLLEAMSYGLPCIVPDCLPGALKHVKDGVTGLVYRAGDQDGLAGCMETLINDTVLRMELGQRARELMKAYSFPLIFSLWDGLLFPKSAKTGEHEEY